MSVCKNGLTIRIGRWQEGSFQRLLPRYKAREFLYRAISAVSAKTPKYWAEIEIGNGPLLSNESVEMPYDEYESSVVCSNTVAILYQGDVFRKHYRLYQGDCSGLISLTLPPLSPSALIRVYERLLSLEYGPDREESLKFLVNQIGPEDLYFYCYEWEHFSFFARDAAIQKIRALAFAERLEVKTSVAFEDRHQFDSSGCPIDL